MYNALLIEDDQQIAELITIHLKDLHFETHHCDDGYEGLKEVLKNSYDICILDLMLPSLDGVEICKTARSKEVKTPIIMLTAKSEEIDRVIGLETGADDYITKPFSIREFKARVKAMMRRTQSSLIDQIEAERIYKYGELYIDSDKRIVKKNGERLDLTTKEFDLLSLIASNPGKSYNRQSLLNLVWGYEFQGFEHTVNSHINRLRAKIEDDMNNPKYILTTWGFGYRFNDDI